MNLEGLTIDRYELERLLGYGGMGEVYLAQDTTIQRQVAIKVIRYEVSPYSNTEAGKISASQHEMKAISQLDHPHILPVYDYGEKTVNGTLLAYMVMPYRKEGSLTQWLQQRPTTMLLSPEETLFFMLQAADALQHAHDHGIVHQDVKPSNFLIRQRSSTPTRPDLFLADFGIAKFINATSTTSQHVRGTPTYMAPEQWQGHPIPATDQYALAIMIYELLTGQAPFKGSMAQMMYQHLSSTPAAPSSLKADLSPYIDAVLLNALEKKPEERFPSINIFIQALQQAIQGVDPQPFMEATKRFTPAIQPADPVDAADKPNEQYRTNVYVAPLPEQENEENIATQVSENSKDLPTIISAKRPAVQPPVPPSSPDLETANPASSPDLEPVSPGIKPTYQRRGTVQSTRRTIGRRTMMSLVVVAILVIALGSGGILLSTRNVESARIASMSVTANPQATATANQAKSDSTALAIVQQQGLDNATSTAVAAHVQQTVLAQQTAQAQPAQNNTSAPPIIPAQNNVRPTTVTIVIVATPVPTPRPIPTPTPEPPPTPTPAPIGAPTITSDCAHLVTPWVALYQYANYGGRELCFEGKGLVNLADYGFDKQTVSINIAANGSFYDQANGRGASLGFYYADEHSDIGVWDNRISSFVVTG